MRSIRAASAMVIIAILLKTSVWGQTKGFVIQGQLKGLQNGSLLYLMRNNATNTASDTLSSTRSNGDRFAFRGHIDKEGDGYFIMFDTLSAATRHLKGKSILIHMENKAIQVRGNIDSLNPFSVDVKGSGVHDDMMAFAREYKRLFVDTNRLNPLYIARHEFLIADDSGRLIGYKDSTAVAELERQIAIVNNMPADFTAQWVQRHLNSLISPFYLLTASDSIQSLLYPKMSKRVQQSHFGLVLGEVVARNKKLMIGRRAPELLLQDPGGEEVSLLEVASKHKLTIVDFWAHWCIPCRESFPALKELYSKYHSKGLAVYGVSVDRQKGPWLKAIAEDKLPWYNVIIPLEGKSPAYELYGVSAVPTCFLLDQKGNILFRWKGGKPSELESYLSRL